ncbi:hypothetical protein HMSSN139_42090 [Paenibacillus sp. HMSSN-139]|nr:hypothetical protein HMSSN139_42090 [Paenibacillus sp. HMSSN-139]
MADVFADQIGTLNFDQVPLVEHPHTLKHFGDDSRYCRFSGARIAFEHHVVDLSPG